MSKDSTNKLNGKDLINIGIFSAIYFVIVGAASMVGYIPVLYPMISIIVPLLGGIPFMLFLTKVKKPGMIFIMSVLMGILMILTGMGFYPLLVSLVTGVIAEFIYKSGDYKSSKKAVLTYAVFGIWMWGNFLLLFINPTGYWATRQDFGQEYIDALTKIMPIWMCPVLLVVTFLFGILGALIGKALMKKHFKKAGIV